MAEFYIEDKRLFARDLQPGSIDDCVQKWQFIIEHHDEIDGFRSIQTCALCEAYQGNCCVGCPIFVISECFFCDNTPFERWEISMFRNDRDEAKKYAQRELKFLMALRDNDLDKARSYLLDFVPGVEFAKDSGRIERPTVAMFRCSGLISVRSRPSSDFGR